MEQPSRRYACFGTYEIDKAQERSCAGCMDSMACASVDEGRIDVIGSNGNEGLHYDAVNRPAHYTQGGIECIEAIRAALTPEEFRGFLKGNGIKYLWRCNHKGGAEDVAKAKWYLERLEQVM